jgi:septal ring factor EnvC (AmiA/AmiB activator)
MTQTTDREPTLTDVLDQISDLKQDVANVKQDVANVKQDVANVKQDVANVKQDVDGLKHDVVKSNELTTRFDQRFSDYQKATQWVVQLAFTLIASATLTVIITSVFKR